MGFETGFTRLAMCGPVLLALANLLQDSELSTLAALVKSLLTASTISERKLFDFFYSHINGLFFLLLVCAAAYLQGTHSELGPESTTNTGFRPYQISYGDLYRLSAPIGCSFRSATITCNTSVNGSV